MTKFSSDKDNVTWPPPILLMDHSAIERCFFMSNCEVISVTIWLCDGIALTASSLNTTTDDDVWQQDLKLCVVKFFFWLLGDTFVNETCPQ